MLVSLRSCYLFSSWDLAVSATSSLDNLSFTGSSLMATDTSLVTARFWIVPLVSQIPQARNSELLFLTRVVIRRVGAVALSWHLWPFRLTHSNCFVVSVILRALIGPIHIVLTGNSDLLIGAVHHLVHVALGSMASTLCSVCCGWPWHSASVTPWVAWGGSDVAILHQLVANLVLIDANSIWAVTHIVVCWRIVVLKLLHLNHWGLVGGLEATLDLLGIRRGRSAHHTRIGSGWTHIGHVIVHATAWLLLQLCLVHRLLSWQLRLFLRQVLLLQIQMMDW